MSPTNGNFGSVGTPWWVYSLLLDGSGSLDSTCTSIKKPNRRDLNLRPQVLGPWLWLSWRVRERPFSAEKQWKHHKVRHLVGCCQAAERLGVRYPSCAPSPKSSAVTGEFKEISRLLRINQASKTHFMSRNPPRSCLQGSDFMALGTMYQYHAGNTKKRRMAATRPVLQADL